MTDTIDLKIKSGGQWLISPVANTKVFIETHFNGEESGYANLIKK